MYQTIFSAHPGLVAKNKHIFNLCLAGKKILKERMRVGRKISPYNLKYLCIFLKNILQKSFQLKRQSK